MGPIISDAVADDGDLRIRMNSDESLGDRFEKLDPFLGRIEARRPVQKDSLGVDDEPGPLLEFDEILPFGGDDVIFAPYFRTR